MPGYLAYLWNDCNEHIYSDKVKWTDFCFQETCSSDMQMTPPLWQKVKNLLVKVKGESEKAGLKLNFKKTKIMASGPITSGK